MTKQEVIEQLKEMGNPRAIKIWARMDMDTSNYLGVGLTKLKNLGKKIKKNHPLSVELWNSGIRDAMLLSFFLADPKEFTPEIINKYIKRIDFWDMSDNFAAT